MNKFGIAVALVVVLVGFVALSSAHKGNREQDFELEESELGAKNLRLRTAARGGKVHTLPYKRHPRRRYRPRYCNGERFEEEEGFEFDERARGGFGVGRLGGEFEDEESFRGDEFRRGGVEGRSSRGGFQAGQFSGVGKSKEFDAGLRTGSKDLDRNQFAKQASVVGADQKAVAVGSHSGESNSVEGIHKHKNLNNDRLVVKETNRGTEDVDGFRAQNSRNDDNNFGASDTKVFGAQTGESGSSDRENEREFDADVHKKSNFNAVQGSGVSANRF